MVKKLLKSKQQYEVDIAARGLVRGLQWVWESHKSYPTVHIDEYTRIPGAGDRVTISGEAVPVGQAGLDIDWMSGPFRERGVPSVLVVYGFSGEAPMSSRMKETMRRRFPAVTCKFPRAASAGEGRDALKLRGPPEDIQAALDACLKEHPSQHTSCFLIKPLDEVLPMDYALLPKASDVLRQWRAEHPTVRAFIPVGPGEGTLTVAGPWREVPKAGKHLAQLFAAARRKADDEAFPKTPAGLREKEQELRRREGQLREREAALARREEACREWETELKKQKVDIELSKLRLASGDATDGKGSSPRQSANASPTSDGDDEDVDDDDQPPKCDWTEYPDPETSRAFFYNIITKVSQWNKPDELIALEKWKQERTKKREKKREEAKAKRASARQAEAKAASQQQPNGAAPAAAAAQAANTSSSSRAAKAAADAPPSEVQQLLKQAKLTHLAPAFTGYTCLNDLLLIEFNQLVSLVPDHADREALTNAVMFMQQARSTDGPTPQQEQQQQQMQQQQQQQQMQPMVQQLQLVEQHPGGLGFGMNTSLHRQMSNAVGFQGMQAPPAAPPGQQFAAVPVQMVMPGMQGMPMQMVPQLMQAQAGGAPIMVQQMAPASAAKEGKKGDVNPMLQQLADLQKPKGKKEKELPKVPVTKVPAGEAVGSVQELFKLMQKNNTEGASALPPKTTMKAKGDTGGGVNLAAMLSSGALGGGGSGGGVNVTSAISAGLGGGGGSNGKAGINLGDWLKGEQSS
eukprot:TRINITY_DN7976_c1_g1_i1.p1 TRINITY_DN7976_c1_g1~~TRINITY_DN7976_c1_g1_i1.p1  ORF type:complete len:745 (+),score=337.88 TRINITY_DN7976_c1_g1_i1:151-2385(+)